MEFYSVESPESSSVGFQDKNDLNIPAFWLGKDVEAVNKATLGSAGSVPALCWLSSKLH